MTIPAMHSYMHGDSVLIEAKVFVGSAVCGSSTVVGSNDMLI